MAYREMVSIGFRDTATALNSVRWSSSSGNTAPYTSVLGNCLEVWENGVSTGELPRFVELSGRLAATDDSETDPAAYSEVKGSAKGGDAEGFGAALRGNSRSSPRRPSLALCPSLPLCPS